MQLAHPPDTCQTPSCSLIQFPDRLAHKENNPYLPPIDPCLPQGGPRLEPQRGQRAFPVSSQGQESKLPMFGDPTLKLLDQCLSPPFLTRTPIAETGGLL